MKNFNQYTKDTYACQLLESLANNKKLDKSEYDAVLEMLLSLYQQNNKLIVETLIDLQDDESYLAESFSSFGLPLLEASGGIPLPDEPDDRQDRHRKPKTFLDKVDKVKNVVMYGLKATQEIEHIKDNLHKATPEQRAAGGHDRDMPFLSYHERKKAFDDHLEKLQGRESPWARKHEDQPPIPSIPAMAKTLVKKVVNKIRR